MLLNSCVVQFSGIICGTQVYAEFQDKIQSGEDPLDAAYSLQEELDMVINEHVDCDLLKSQISQLTNLISDGSESENQAELLVMCSQFIISYNTVLSYCVILRILPTMIFFSLNFMVLLISPKFERL